MPDQVINTPAQARMLPYHEAEALLRRYDIPLAASRLVQSSEEAVAAAAEIGYPVALKAISAQATHKSDAGLLHLGIAAEETLAAAARQLLLRSNDLSRSQVRSDDFSRSALEGLLVQAMAPPGIEMIAGISHDPQFGPVLALGSGGILVELLDDVALRLPPLSPAEARRMITGTRAWPLLQGFRGRPPADVDALADLMVNLSRLSQDNAQRLLSLDLNPIIVLPRGEGVQVVDLRVAVRQP